MVFSDLLFLYLFLPLNLLSQRFASTTRGKNWIMLAFSLFFYAWGEPVYVLLLVGMVFADWLFSLAIANRKQQGRSAKPPLVMACVVSLGILAVFKYGMFLLENFRALFHLSFSVPEIALPIGISFYTFQVLTYVVDVYRGETEAQTYFPDLLMYVSLFHQCIAGPIVRYHDVAREIRHRSVSWSDAAAGVSRFSVGLAKKALLANPCGGLADRILLSADAVSRTGSAASLAGQSASALALGVLAYTLQIYLDFSAYSDMAIGMGLMVGFHYRENFDYPYTAMSVSDFWRRWHISLGAFFRDYVYIPLGGNREGRYKTARNLFIVWFLTGLWHGASWNFVLWGLYFCVLIAVEKLLPQRRPGPAGQLLRHLYLLLAVYFGWILFRFRDLTLVWTVVRGLFGGNGNPLGNFESGILWSGNLFLLLVCAVACTPLPRNLLRFLRADGAPAAVRSVMGALDAAAPVALLFLSTLALVGNSYNPFIYFQF